MLDNTMKVLRRILATALVVVLCCASFSTNVSAVTKKASNESYTLMVYMVGSDLESEGQFASQDIAEMILSGVDVSNTNVIVYGGGSKQWHILDCKTNFLGNIVKSDNELDMELDISKKAENMAEPASLTEFLDTGYNKFSADHYALILWDHGAGPVHGYGVDELFNGDKLSLEKIDKALADSQLGKTKTKLDFIGFDACLMASVETANVLSKYANYMIASEETEPGSGWDYTSLKILNETCDTEKIGKAIIDAYSAEKNASMAQRSLSLLKLSEVSSVNSCVDQFFDKMEKDLVKTGNIRDIDRIRNKTKVFSEGTPVEVIDLGDYAKNAETLYKKEANNLANALDKLVVYQKTNIKNASGVSMYYPYRYASQYTYEATGDDKGKKELLASGAMDYSKIAVSKTYNDFLTDYWSIVITGELSGNGHASSNSAQEPVTSQPSTPPVAETQPETGVEIVEEDVPEDNIEPTVEGHNPEIDYTVNIKENSSKDKYVVSLSKSQKDIFSSAQFNIYMRTDKKDYYEPVLIGKELTAKTGTEFEIAKDQQIITFETLDEKDIPYWPLKQIASYDSISKYRTYSTALEGPYGAMAWTKPTAVCATVEENNQNGQKEIISITYNPEVGQHPGKDNVDLSKFDYLSYYTKNYKVVLDKKGNALPFEKWEKGSTLLARQISLDSDISIVSNNTSDMEGEFVGQFVWTDVYGNSYGSKLLELTSLGTPKSYSEKTDGATVTYSLYNDCARVDKIEGNSNKVTIPSNVSNLPVKKVGSNVVKGQIREIVVPGCIEKIGYGAFAGSKSLEKITFEEGVTAISTRAVADCEKLSEVKLPNSLKSIGKFAFSKDKGLKKLEIPKSVNRIGSGAFEYCHFLKEITVASGNSAYKAVNDSEGSVIFTADGKKLVAAPGLFRKNYNIPNGTEEIQDFAFCGSYYEEIRQNDGKGTVVGYGLCDVSFPDSLKVIGDGAFFECNRFKKLELPNNLEVIGMQAFGGTDFTGSALMTSYEKVTLDQIIIGPNVDWVGQKAFCVYKVDKFVVDSKNQNYYAENGKLKNKLGFSDNYTADK